MRPENPTEGRHASSLRPRRIDSGDGVLLFELTRSTGGVHVKRTHRRSVGGQIDCCMGFRDEADFARWTDVDQLRFTYPLVFQRLARAFSELIAQEGPDDAFHA